MNNSTATPTYDVSFRCCFKPGRYTKHSQDMPLEDIQHWINIYQFTRPECENIVIKIWPKKESTAYEPFI